MKQDTVLMKVIIGLMLLVITVYMLVSGLQTLSNPHRMVIVYNDVVESSLGVNGWFFRKEVRLDAASGLISYRLDEGEKAAAGQVAAVSYQSEEALSRQHKIRTVSTQISQLEYALSEEALTGNNLESQMLSTITKIQSIASKGDYTQLVRQADEYKRLILRREYLYSETSASDLGLASLSLKQELESLQQYTRDDAQIIYTPKENSGIFSTYVDGYEPLLDPDALHEISVSEFRDLVSQAPISNDGSVGKVAISSDWYYAMIVKEEDLQRFQQYSQVSLRISSLADAIPMSVSEIGYVENGEAVVVLSSKRNLDDVIDLRAQAGSIVFRSEQGIRIPKNALRVQDDNSVGVYTATAFRAEFKPVKIVAEDQDDYIVTANPKNNKDKRILRSGDEVIITAAELYEGKVVR